MLEHWTLDPEVVYLNHGTVGVPPRRVLEAQQRIRDLIERQPARFLLRELTAVAVRPWDKPRMRAAADAVAVFLGARGDDLVFVDNATTGVNAVLRSIDWRAGDEILITGLTYGAVANAAHYVGRERDVAVRAVELPFPVDDPGEITAAVAAAIGPRTRLALIDHVTSESAQVLPIAEIAAACAARGVAVLVDGAHAPGALALDIPALEVDWYVGNLHKWAYSPRSCGILWAGPPRQVGLHPTVISWGLDQGFTTEFDLVGTRDPSAHLAAPEGIAFLRELGHDAVRAYNHRLAWDSAVRLTKHWGTDLGLPESMVGTMATIPLPDRAGSTSEDAANLRDALLFEDGIEVQMHESRGRLWVRISGQIYNDGSDVDRLVRAVDARIG
jgi:isopenicillin-N epimerase